MVLITTSQQCISYTVIHVKIYAQQLIRLLRRLRGRHIANHSLENQGINLTLLAVAFEELVGGKGKGICFYYANVLALHVLQKELD